MHSARDPFRIAARLCGRAASRALASAGRGRVIAVFRSTFYVELDAGLVCIGGETLDPSPVNLVTTAPAGTDWRATGVRCGMSASVSQGVLRIGYQFSFSVSDAEDWLPEAFPSEVSTGTLERGIRALRREARKRRPEAGLGRFLDPDPSISDQDAFMTAARERVSKARRWIASALEAGGNCAGDCAWVGAVAGLGPGLTPSGDDFIGGAMIALRALDEMGACDRIWSETRCQAGIRSNPISFAHLSAAAAGEGAAPIHRLLNHVASGRTDRISVSLGDIGGIGQSSGWDAVVGMEAALDGWLRAHAH